MSSHLVGLVHPDYIGLSPSPDCKINSWNKNTFERKSKSLRKNLFPEKYPALFDKTKKVLSIGIAKINKAFSDFKYSVQSATQSLRFNSYKRYEFEDCGKISTCITPNRNARSALGRTPTKLYSPFGIETPASSKY